LKFMVNIIGSNWNGTIFEVDKYPVY